MKRIFNLLILTLLAFGKANAHNVLYYTTCGYVCAGSNMTVDASIANAGSSTRYAWQYKDNSGTWKCFVNGSNTINGTAFTVSGATAANIANDAPLLTINSATTALENVQVRVLMTDGGDPCATSPSYAVWGGDADPDNKYMSIRLHVLSGSDCGTISTYCAQGGCNGNTLSDANGYYGGLESSNNGSGGMNTDYASGGSTPGQFAIVNNVRTIQSGFPAFAPRSGNYMAYVDGSTDPSKRVLYKSVSLTAGNTYQFSVWIANANNASTNLPFIQLRVNGTVVATGTVSSTAGDWLLVQGTYDATSSGTVLLEIFDSNIQSGNNDFVLDDMCFKSLGATTTTCASGYFNPFSPAEGYNVFVKNGINFQQGHTDAGVAMGGDATMNGNVNLALFHGGSYPYGAGNANNYGIVVGGKMVFTSGQQSTVNNGYFRLGNTTNSRLFYKDCNNSNTNFKVTPYNADCQTAFNSQPQLALQQQQANGTATDAHGLDFNTAFTTFQTYSNYMAAYTSSSSCASSLNIITLNSGSNTITLVDNKVNVINVTTAQFTAVTSLTFNNAPTATRPLVFNINGTSSFTWSPFNVGGLSNNAGAYIVYNFYNNTGTINLTGGNQVFGTILCPGAAFQKNHSGNTEGQIVATSFVLNGGEVHYQPFDVCLPICTSGGGTNCTKTNETIPNQFNTGFGAPLTNSTFTGSTGTWTVNSNAQATAVCVQPYYNPSSSHAIKITNWNTSGKGAGTVNVASPKVDLTNACCPTELNLNFTLWTYTCVSGDNNAALDVDFSSDNGATWTEVWSRTSAQLFTAYGANGKTTITINVPTGYQTANFRYRFRGDMAANNPNNFYQFIDDISISSPTTCSGFNLGNTVWYDMDNDGIQEAGEPGIAGVVVKLYNCSGTYLNKTATTDANGNYQFTGIAAGSYIVGITTPAGYTKSDVSSTSISTDSQNDGTTIVSTEIRTGCFTFSGSSNNIDFGLKGTGSIGDFVWYDIDNDGIQETGETGIAGATVTLTYPGGSTKVTTTDANGAYSFTNLAPGTYSVAFTTPSGYTASVANQGSDDTKDSDPVSGVVSGIVLTAGQSNTTVDAGFYQKLNLGNLVWYDINNNGVKDTNEPGVSGATVKLYLDANGDNTPDGAAVSSTTTDANGLYSFTGLNPGKYIVGVTLPSGYVATATTTNSSNPNSDTDNDNNGVTTVSGEVRSNFITLASGSEPATGVDGDGTNGNLTLDFGLKGTGSIGDFVWFDIDNDGIQETGETGIAGATVTLTYPSGATATTTTDANGAYSFTNLIPGNYTVTFTTPTGYFASAANQGTDDTKDSDPVSGSVSVTLTAGQSNTTVDAGFYQKMNLGNLVWFDANNNGLKDANEPGISGVTVKLYLDANADNTPDGAAVSTTTTDANGFYSFTGLTPNNYIVGVTLPTGHVATITTTNSSNPNSNTDNDNNGVTTVSGELRSNYITLSYGAEPASGVDGDGVNGNLTLDFGLKGSLNLGNLVWNDTNGNGIKNTLEAGITGVTVYLYQDANADNVPDGAAIATTTTTTGGIYGFSNLVPGNYIVGIATPAGFANSFKPTNNANPNSDVDNDNNGVTETGGIIRSNYITLSVGGEPALTTDGDGTNGNLTLDFGVAKDTDGDDVPDVIDIDDDNDGITDMNESGGYDPLADCDGDGIPNYMDATPGCSTPAGNDPWGKPYVALTWVDCNVDGINDFFDFDRDGIINELDLDSDNDGILDVLEARPNSVAVTATANGMITGTDADGNGLLSSYENGNSNPVLNGISAQDLDRDGLPNFLDLDSDGDGLTDLTEALNVYSSTGVLSGTDSDGDGVRSETFGSSAANVADNINGFGAKGLTLLNSDANIAGVSTTDDYPNVYDVDSDNDGITDNVEAQATCSYKVPTGVDCDGDGVDDAYDATSQCVTCTRTSAGLTPFDKDGDGTPDYLDLDTDNDGAWDIYEGHTVTTTEGHHSVPPVNYWTGSVGDADKDGLLDYFDNFNIINETANRHSNSTSNNMGTNGSFTPGVAKPGSIVQLPESDEKGGCAGGGERDWRTVTILPVKLVEFKGNLAGNNVNLSWTVANETNMSGYDVERSVDAVNFTKVATVKATAAVSSNKTYTTVDNINNIASGKVYYRLKQLDQNGSYTYSSIINFRLNSKGIVMAISPNPAISFVNIKLSVVKDGMAFIKVTDMIGRTVNTQTTKVSTGINSIAINNLSSFSAGTYNVQVMVDGEVFNEKLVVTK